jgi:hypothetical protein
VGQTAGDRLTADAPPIQGETRRLRFGLADGADNADIRRLLRDTPVAGWVSLSYEREPDYFRAATVEGDVHETLVGRDRRTGELIVMASFSVQDAWVNGKRARVGYLGQLRLAARHLSRPWPVLEGYRFIRRMVERRPAVRHVLTSIVSTNMRAKRLLTSGSRNLPVYAPLQGFWTLAYPCRRRRDRTAGSELLSGSESDAEDISRFLEQQASRFQFAPSWHAERLWGPASCPDLAPGDFLLAKRGTRLVGCIALWDQGGFKQHVVRGYAPWVARCRPLLNVGAALSGLPRLPSVGSPLREVSLSHLAVAEDDPGVFEALLRGALGRARDRGYQLAVTGMAQGHPLLEPARRFARHMAYQSDIYRVHWDEPGSPADLDKRPLHLEAAIL